METNDWLNETIKYWKQLPGIGEKSALRILMFLLSKEDKYVENFANKLIETKKNIKFCSVCGALTIDDPCNICTDRNRDQSTIMILEKPQDIFTMENSNIYKGVYHILGGLLSPLHGITPDKIRLAELKERINNNNIEEIIIATSPTVEGETTALYIKNMFEDQNIKISRIASGIPFGLDIEYSDERTLSRAISYRIMLKEK